MNQYKSFIFGDYEFNQDTKTLSLHYLYEGGPKFTETFKFDFDFIEFDAQLLDLACQTLFFIAGISYFKAYLPPQIRIAKGTIDAGMAAFLNRTYQQGLGEFFYVNKLDPHTPITFPSNTVMSMSPLQTRQYDGQLIGLGGGKDSLVTVEILRNQPNVATWSLNHRSQLTPLVERIGLPHFWVERNIDPALLTANDEGALNGHVPISAILAATGTIVAILTGFKDVVVSNEHSANEPTLHYQGVDINHQYSKSLVFEKDYQTILARNFSGLIRYYSFLRPLSEVYIAELFSRTAFEKYKDVFSSCNKAFTHDSNHMFWCGECPKCAFVFLSLTPFMPREWVESLFGGRNLLLEPSFRPTYRQLLGIEGDKPLECVGEIKECRSAMQIAFNTYPELAEVYTFELPNDYNVHTLTEHSMPEEFFNILQSALQN